METIPKSGCLEIGFFRKTHGVHGELVLEFESDYELSVSETGRYFVELEGLLVPFFVAENGFRFKSSKSAIVNFEWIDNEEYARRLVGCPVYIYKSEIIDEKKELTSSQYVNYLLFDEKLGEIGLITKVDDFSGNIVFSVHYKGEEILVPFNNDFLVSINEKVKTITLNLPNGLIET